MKLGATDFSAGHNFHFLNAWAVDAEDTLYSSAVGDLTDGEAAVEAVAIALSDDDALEKLDPLFVPFFNFGVDLDGISDVEVGSVLLELLLFDLGDEVHGVGKFLRTRGLSDGVHLCKPFLSARRSWLNFNKKPGGNGICEPGFRKYFLVLPHGQRV